VDNKSPPESIYIGRRFKDDTQRLEKLFKMYTKMTKKGGGMSSIFYMWETRRRNLMAEHKFYVSEGKRRLTDQFSDSAKLEREADEFGRAWLEEAGKHFDPDRDDAGLLSAQAHDEGIQHYQALDALGNSGRLALIVGMFHMWERSLREWLTSYDSIGHFQVAEHLPKAIRGANFSGVLGLFEGVGLFQIGCSIRDQLNVCRMIVNTYKHGAGYSADQLKTARPELFDQYGWRSKSNLFSDAEWADYSDQNAMPEHIMVSSIDPVPKWFHKALDKDCKGASNG
jgi:hypothetical protein